MLQRVITRCRIRTACFWCLLGSLPILFATPATLARAAGEKASGADIAVVVNATVPVDDLSLPELRKVLLGDRQFWSSSQRVTLLIRAPVARERDVLLRRVYQMSEAQFRQYWIAKVFRAETTSGPKIIYSNKVATDLVNALPGSIAFVDATQVPKGMKVLKVDGRLPGDPGYVLSN